MKRIGLIAMLFLIFTSFVNLNAQWARTYGGNENELAYSFQQTSDGGYIVAGQTKTYGAGGYDAWILKLDSNGIIEWQRTYGRGGSDYAYSIQQTNDGGYIVAGVFVTIGRDFWILKLSSAGDIEWQKTYGGSSNDAAFSIQQTSDGGYIVAGENPSFGAGNSDFWVLKLYSNGDIEWQKTYGGGDFDGAYSIQQTNEGGYIVAGITFSFGAGTADAWILKLNSDGTIEWQRIYGGIGTSEAYSIQQTNDGGYIVAGLFSDVSSGFWVLKLYSNGDIEWQRMYGGSGGFTAYSIQQTSDGGYVVAGDTSAFGAGNSDFWVLKLYSNGDIEWQRTYGGSDLDSAQCIQQSSDGSYIVAGFTKSFGAGGPYDFLIFKLYSDGDVDQSCGFIGSSNASVADTAVSPADTAVSPADTAVSPAEPIYSTQDTYEIANLFCEAPKYTITISYTDKCTAVVITSSIDPAPGLYTSYYNRTEVQIEAIPDVGYDLLYWSGDVPSGQEYDNPIMVIMDSDKSIRAHFRYTLAISTSYGGTTDPTPGNNYYDYGTAVIVTAIADNGYRFENWSGDVSSTDNPVEIIMDGDKTISANFIRQYTLTITANYGGTTDPSPGTYTYDEGTQVTLTAIANSNYKFTSWTGSLLVLNTNPTIEFMNSDGTITANFTQISAGDGDTGGGGGCLIATAAYGSPLHPHVKILRDLRDEYLMTNKIGQMFVGQYYKYSPDVSSLIKKHNALRIIIRNQLVPFVGISYIAVHFGPAVTAIMFVLILAIPIFYMSSYRRRLI